MKTKSLFSKFHFDKLKLKTGFLELEITFNEKDKNAAWEMYVELLTRITTQRLKPEDGDEKTALTSIFALFQITRDILKKNGKECVNFTKIAIIVLNQIIRPFTAKWHKISITDGFLDNNNCTLFRDELEELQSNLRNYTKLLSDIAEVEDLTIIEEV